MSAQSFIANLWLLLRGYRWTEITTLDAQGNRQRGIFLTKPWRRIHTPDADAALSGDTRPGGPMAPAADLALSGRKQNGFPEQPRLRTGLIHRMDHRAIQYVCRRAVTIGDSSADFKTNPKGNQ